MEFTGEQQQWDEILMSEDLQLNGLHVTVTLFREGLIRWTGATIRKPDYRE
jgi:hypothetical protein